jgi:hypothetical protein
MISGVISNPALVEHYRYGGHGFPLKENTPPLWAADIFAWQWRKALKDRAHGKMKPRADLLSLMENKEHWSIHFDKKTILAFADQVRKTNEEIQKREQDIAEAIAADAVRRRAKEDT